MKKYILILLTIIIAFSTQAQNKPDKNFFGIGIDYKLQREVHIVQGYDIWPDPYAYDYRIESYNYFPALKFDYYLSKSLSLNLFYRPSFVNKTEKRESFSNYKNYNVSSLKLFSMDIGLGGEYHFMKNKKIDPFAGLSLHYLYSGKENSISESRSYDYSTGELRSTYLRSSKGVGTHGVYTTANFGMNYFILQNFSLGINLDLGYRYSLQKGTAKSVTENTEHSSSGDIVTTNESTSDINNENSGFIYSFSIKSSFYFPLTKKQQQTK